MRYFRYTPKYIKETATTSPAEKKRKAYRRYRVQLYLRTAIVFVIFIFSFILTECIAHICPALWGRLLCRAIGFILYIFILFRLVKYWALKKPLVSLSSDAQKSAACAHLREYYGMSEHFLITKCYESTDSVLSGKDICLFFTENELRITADIANGFLDQSKDLGCYAFTKEKYSFDYTNFEGKKATEIKDENFTMTVGRRAKIFIENQDN